MSTEKQKTKKKRMKPGRSGEGEFYHIGVRPKGEFETFRTHDVGREGHIERVAGKRSSGSWDTVKWLVNKEDASKKGKTLIAISKEAKELFDNLGSKPKLVKGDYFEAKPRKNIPEKDKPTKAQQKARKENIKKAQKARKSS